MNRKSAPYLIVAATAVIATLLGAWMAIIATHQPWLGLELEADGLENGLRIAAVAAAGPSRELIPGTRLVSIDDGNARSVDFEPLDIIDEPDGMNTYAAFRTFFERQQTIHTILLSDSVFLTTGDGARMPVDVADRRPVSDLPHGFWMLIGVGLAGSIVAASVWALRPRMAGAQALGFSGMALLGSTYPSAVYINRELALSEPLFVTLTTVNPLGSLAFGVCLLILFLVYPRRLLPPALIMVLICIFGAWWLLDAFRLVFPGPAVGRYVPISLATIGAAVMVGIQFWIVRRDPQLRAALGWFGLSLVLSGAVYILAFVTPGLIGEPAIAPQLVGYSLALLIYGGIALGVGRYQLFDLDRWAFRILFYVGGALTFAALDIFLVLVVALDTLPAFSLALLIVALAYLPLRDFLARRFMPAPEGRSELFQNVVDVALTAEDTTRHTKWVHFLRQIYDPLTVEEVAEHSTPAIVADGNALLIPGQGFVGPLKLTLAHGGRKLFSASDLELAEELSAMLLHVSQSRDAFQRGSEQERDRIARDTHDNIGAKLLSALHGTEPERKDAMIREALSELRDVINHPSGTAQTLEEALAELRFETVDRIHAAGLQLDWNVNESEQTDISADIIHALKSIIRESVSNALRHSGASTMTIAVALRDEKLLLTISDDGTGMTKEEPVRKGLGLDSIRARLEALSATFQITSLHSGFHLSAEIPTETREAL